LHLDRKDLPPFWVALVYARRGCQRCSNSSRRIIFGSWLVGGWAQLAEQ